MALVSYSDSESDLEPDQAANKANGAALPKRENSLKRKHSISSSSAAPKPERQPSEERSLKNARLPQPPSTFQDLYATSVRLSTSDDPALHAGRQRATPHIVGNWPTHVYIEYCADSLASAMLSSVITKYSSSYGINLTSLLESDLGAPLPLHISLSQSLSFRTEQKDQFTQAIRREILCSGIKEFELLPTTVSLLPNQQCTRSFLVLHLARPPCDSLNRLLRACNHVAKSFKQATLYEHPPRASNGQDASEDAQRARDDNAPTITEEKAGEDEKSIGGATPSICPSLVPEGADASDATPNFHISLAWALGVPASGMEGADPDIAAEVSGLRIPVAAVKVKMGNVIESVELGSKGFGREGRGWLGE